jgi:hypothetical protein
MNQDSADGLKDSDRSSASPAASSSSDGHDEISSVETTPPPQPDEVPGSYSAYDSKRYSANSSAYSHSYSGNSVFSESAPNGPGYFSHYRQWSQDGRPATSGTSVAGSNYEDEEQAADLAAAVGLLSCSYGTPKSGPAMLPPDIPPVPPLPARFLGQTADLLSGSSSTLVASQSSIPKQRYSDFRHQGRDVEMVDDNESMDNDDDYRRPHRTPQADEDEEGVFGRMDE